MVILETERLVLRELTAADRPAVAGIMQDPEAMIAYEGPFTAAELDQWLLRQAERYRTDGFGLWAVVLKAGGEVIGQCGLTLQPWDGRTVPEVGYLFLRRFWHRGYATEAAAACVRYGFEVLGMDEISAIVRDTNTASRAVAGRIGMTARDRWVKRYRGVDMPHTRFARRADQSGP